MPIVPIVFPTLTLGASFKLGGTLGFDLPTHAKYIPNARGPGKGQWELSIDPERRGMVRDIFDPFGAGAAFEAEAKLSFPLKALVFGVAGPYLGPTLSAKGELKFGTPALTENPCKKLFETCVGVKAAFGGEWGVGCPWIEEIETKQEIEVGEFELFKRCTNREEEDLAKCQDSGTGVDPGGSCVPQGTASGAPKQQRLQPSEGLRRRPVVLRLRQHGHDGVLHRRRQDVRE